MKHEIIALDNRRQLIIGANTKETILFSAQQFIEIGKQAISHHGRYNVALSGGSTPLAIFKELSSAEYIDQINWSKVSCFWSDERSEAATTNENNYFSAMQAGLSKLPLLPENIHRMQAETQIEENAAAYEELIKLHVPHERFDLIMLGMGEDGHTASLFPRTHGLHAKGRLVIANEVPQKHTWRMTLTYECIHKASHIFIYVTGENKAETVAEVLLSPFNPDHYPIQKIGTESHPATWILDYAAASVLLQRFANK